LRLVIGDGENTINVKLEIGRPISLVVVDRNNVVVGVEVVSSIVRAGSVGEGIGGEDGDDGDISRYCG
jgi:hypothetical protein